MGWQLVSFGRLAHRIIEAVAKQAQLVPVELAARSLLPIRAPNPI